MTGKTMGLYELLLTMATLYRRSGSVGADACLLQAEAATVRLIDEHGLPYLAILQLLHDFLYMGRGSIARKLVQHGRASGHDNGLPQYQECLARVEQLLTTEPIPPERVINALYTLKSTNYESLHHPGQSSFAKVLKTVGVARLGSAVDLGCGAGWVGDQLRAQGYAGDLTGIDLSRAMLDICGGKGHYQRLVDGNFFDILDATEDRFALATMLWVSVHLTLTELRRVFQSVRRVLNPGGLFLFDAYVTEDHVECLTRQLGLPRSATSAIEASLKEAGFVPRFVESAGVRYYWCRKLKSAG